MIPLTATTTTIIIVTPETYKKRPYLLERRLAAEMAVLGEGKSMKFFRREIKITRLEVEGAKT